MRRPRPSWRPAKAGVARVHSAPLPPASSTVTMSSEHLSPTGSKEGYGVYQFADGMRYEGQFSGGKRHGSGVYTYPTGARFIGEWVDGRRVGGEYVPAPR